jgi:hypothetical protein
MHAVSLNHSIDPHLVRVRAGAEVPASPRLAVLGHRKYEVVNKGRTKKRGRGRPPTGGRDPHVAIRMPQTLIDQVDAWGAENEGARRSEAFRRLVELGLKAKK